MSSILKLPFSIFWEFILVEYVEISDILRLKVAFTNTILQNYMQVSNAVVSIYISSYCLNLIHRIFKNYHIAAILFVKNLQHDRIII